MEILTGLWTLAAIVHSQRLRPRAQALPPWGKALIFGLLVCLFAPPVVFVAERARDLISQSDELIRAGDQ